MQQLEVGAEADLLSSSAVPMPNDELIIGAGSGARSAVTSETVGAGEEKLTHCSFES